MSLPTLSNHSQHVAVQRNVSANEYAALGGVPLVIDNGSFEVRAGWATDANPRLVCRNLVGVPRNRRDTLGDYIIVGDAALEHNANRINTRSPFDRNVVYHAELMEHVLDHAFSVCGVQGGGNGGSNTGSVAHPIVMTEPVCVPAASRALVSELLFECYNVPAVCYGVDALFSYDYNVAAGHVPSPATSSSSSSSSSSSPLDVSAALLVSAGWHATHALPVVDGRVLFDRVRRLDIGGSHAHAATRRWMQLKYPHHRHAFTDVRAFELLERYSRVALDYASELECMADFFLPVPMRRNPQRAAAMESRMCAVFQLPFTPSASDAVSGATKSSSSSSSGADGAEGGDARERARVAQAQRMRDMQQRARQRKLTDRRAVLEALLELRVARECGALDERAFAERLVDDGFEDEAAFERTVADVTREVESLEAKCRGEPDPHERAQNTADTRPLAELYPLLAVPDAQLTDDAQRRAKRAQQAQAARTQKRRDAAAQAEARAAAERAAHEHWVQRHAREPAAVVAELRARRAAIAEQRARRERDARLAGERGSAAQKRRMRIVAQLAGGGQGNARERKQEAATEARRFGDGAHDWDAYRSISASSSSSSSSSAALGNGYGSDGEHHAIDAENAELSRIEAVLAEVAPDALLADFSSASGGGVGGAGGIGGYSVMSASASSSAFVPTTAQDFQVIACVERIRARELLFQPSIIGSDSRGLAQLCASILDALPAPVAARAAANVFVCGGHAANTPADVEWASGLVPRLAAELRATRPLPADASVDDATYKDTRVCVYAARDVRHDAWRGARRLAAEAHAQGASSAGGLRFTTRAEYHECGTAHQHHHCANAY